VAFHTRPARLPEEYPALARVITHMYHHTVSPEEAQDRDAYIPADGILHRIVAEDEAGALIGTAAAFRYPTTPSGKFYVEAVVLPEARCQGVGSALTEAITRFVGEHNATYLIADVLDDQPDSLAFAQKRGYAIISHGFDSTLDLTAYDHTPFAGAKAAAEAHGIRFFPLAEAPGSETEERLYELYRLTMPDIPGYEASGFMSMQTWRRMMFESGGCRRDWVIVAAADDQLVGVTTLIDMDDHAYTNHTLVDPAFRGRGIALALKAMTIDLALQAGHTQMRTGNDSRNAPMLAVNRKLGYKAEKGGYTIRRDITR
jgi:GNAT superfamily N-acetyltransferase